MQTSYIEKSKRVGGSEKRSLDASRSLEGQPERKRPALASVIVEALKVDSLHKLCSSLEPILRKVVSEEIEHALAKLGHVKPHERVSQKRIDSPDQRNLQLQFRSTLSLPIFTGAKVEGEQGTILHVVLVDASTGHFVTSGPESSVKLDIVVLEGDFNSEDDDGWSREEFESHIVREREGKRPLLTGDLQVSLREGVGTLGELTFTDNSSWIRSRKFRLGLKVSSGSSEGIRIREAKTDAFIVKDHRGELYKKHYPPDLNDEVWRLEKIGKDGSFHKRLNKAGIHKVEDFLRLSERDPQKLRKILGNGMSNKIWNSLIEHAKTCVLSGKFYVYYPDDSSHLGVIFNNIYALSGLIAGGEYYSVDSLSESQKLTLDSLVKKAYENWHVIEYDGKSLMGFDPNRFSDAYFNDLMIQTQDQPHSSEILSFPSLPASIPGDHGSQGSTIVGYNNIGWQNVMVPQNVNPNVAVQLGETSFSLPNQLMISAVQSRIPGSENTLALGPLSNFPTGDSSNAAYMEIESIPLEEIRLRSHDMLQSEDMQHLLHMLSTGGHANLNLSATENSYSDLSYSPIMNSDFGFDENHFRHSSGKAAVGWLKLKAALRWGIFVRKKAAERRAQLVELTD